MLQFYSADVPYSVQKFVDLNAAEFILKMIYADALRDEEGGTFGASSRIGLQYNPIERATIQVIFDASEANQANLRELEISGLKGLAELEKVIGNILADGIKSVLSEILAGGNFIEIVMRPEK